MKKVMLLCMGFALGLVSSSFALDPLLIGNFELPIDGDGDGNDDRYEDWMSDFEDISVTTPAIAVTRGTKALKLVHAEGGWNMKISMPFGEYGQTLETNARANAMVQEKSAWSIDVTVFPGEVVEPVTLALHGEGGGLSWGLQTPDQPIIVDGLPHTYVIVIPQNVKDALPDGINSWYCNLGFGFTTGSGSATIYVDNIWIWPDGYVAPDGPYGRWEEQEFNVNPEFVDLVLHWKAGADPNDEYAVNPLIVDQYVFMTNGSDTDPNLYYLGSTGEDPGLTDPNSQYPAVGTLLLPINSTYQWAVVEALEGHEQVLTGDNTILDADPNNIIGPIWSFNTLSTLPSITTQPTSIRIPLGGSVDPAFSVVVQSATPPSYQWYSSLDAVRDPDDEGGADPKVGTPIGGDTSAMKISNASAGYQRYFYCKVWNAATQSGGGAYPDVYSNIVTCVVERKVAEYKFENNLTDTGSNIATDLNHGTARNGAGFSTDHVEGAYSLSLDGSVQYVELGSSTDPNTFNKCYPRAAFLAEDGIGGGLDTGTIMCWVKLDATAADEVSPIMYNANAGWPTTIFQFDIPTDSAAANTNLRTAIWGDDEVLTMVDVNPAWADPFNMGGDGQWHMLASAWDRNAGTMKAYLDGSLLATWGAEPSEFSAWDNTMTIGFDGTNYFDGLIDNLRVYNYEVAAEVIAQEYYNVTGDSGCIYLDFAGSNLNADNTGTSYCRVDIADLAAFAGNWLNDGFYP